MVRQCWRAQVSGIGMEPVRSVAEASNTSVAIECKPTLNKRATKKRQEDAHVRAFADLVPRLDRLSSRGQVCLCHYREWLKLVGVTATVPGNANTCFPSAMAHD